MLEQILSSLIFFSILEHVNEIIVTWSTMDDVGSDGSIVEYGINGFALTARGTTEKFVDGGPAKHTQYIHRVRFQNILFFKQNNRYYIETFIFQVSLQNLTPEMRYVYHCGSDLGWSAEYFFDVPRTDADWAPHIAIFGDMGMENAQSLPRLQREAQRGMYDAIIHVRFFNMYSIIILFARDSIYYIIFLS